MLVEKLRIQAFNKRKNLTIFKKRDHPNHVFHLELLDNGIEQKNFVWRGFNPEQMLFQNKSLGKTRLMTFFPSRLFF